METQLERSSSMTQESVAAEEAVPLEAFQAAMSERSAVRRRIKYLLDLLDASAENVLLIVPLDEFGMWLALLGAETFWITPKAKGGVGVHVSRKHGDMFIQVHASAAAVEGHEFAEDAEALTLPVGQLSTLIPLAVVGVTP
jgi:hypothetical protein